MLATAALTVAAPSAWAAPAWLAQPDLTAAGTSASAPGVAMNGAGDSIVAWQRAGDFFVQASQRPGGTGFSAPGQLGVAGLEAFGTPQVAIDGDGDAVVVWQEPDGAGLNTVVRAAIRPAGGSFGAPLRLSRSGSVAIHPQLAMNAAGDAVVVWEFLVGQTMVVQAAVRPAGGTFAAPVNVSAAGLTGPLPRAAIDGAGSVTVVWQQAAAANAIVQAATRPAGGTFTTPVDLSAPGAVSSAQVATNAAGETVAVWARVDATPVWVVQGATRSSGGAFSAAADLSAAGHDGIDPCVAVDAAGNAVAVWTRFDGASRVVQVATRPPGRGFGAARDLSLTGREARVPQLAVNPAGDAVVAWQRSAGTSTIVQATFARAGAGFAPATDLSLAGRDAIAPQVGIDADGDAVVGWQRSDGVNTIVQAAGYDGAGPQLRGLSVPGAVAATTPAKFSLSPLDVWSPVASTLWAFDDGATAAGASVAHALETPGDHTATVTATDALGNASSATRTVTVGSRPPAGAARPTGAASTTTPPRRRAAPSNRFTVTVTKARAGGVIRLVLRAKAAGAYRAVATRRLSSKRTSAYGRGRATARRAGRVSMTIRPTRAAKRRLTSRGARIAVVVTFKPKGGTSRNKRLTVVVKGPAGR
ncbi:MAG TPA: PKD domain-containing protein [Solirubrobacteraceae bacterium]|nr:PKD domain-containing protein [Solirubrobacteraceae bacterium]